MTLQSSGTIYASQVNTELGRSSTQYFSLTDTCVEYLMGNPGVPYYMSYLYGKGRAVIVGGSGLVKSTNANIGSVGVGNLDSTCYVLVALHWVKNNYASDASSYPAYPGVGSMTGVTINGSTASLWVNSSIAALQTQFISQGGGGGDTGPTGYYTSQTVSTGIVVAGLAVSSGSSVTVSTSGSNDNIYAYGWSIHNYHSIGYANAFNNTGSSSLGASCTVPPNGGILWFGTQVTTGTVSVSDSFSGASGLAVDYGDTAYTATPSLGDVRVKSIEGYTVYTPATYGGTGSVTGTWNTSGSNLIAGLSYW